MHTCVRSGSTLRARELVALAILLAAPGTCPAFQAGVVERFSQRPGEGQPATPDSPPAEQPAGAPAGATSASTLGAPDPAETLRCLGLVRSWLDAWEVSGVATPVAAACVTIRLGTEIIGRGEAISDAGADGRGVLESAARAAIGQARARMPLQQDALGSERQREFARSLSVSVELGGLPIPVEVESFEQAALSVSPGITGVGARAGTGASPKVSLVWPSEMLRAGLDSGAALATAASQALEQGDAGLSGAKALQDRGVRFLAFECSWAAEVGPDRAAYLLQRGERVFETRDVSSPMLRGLGNSLAAACIALAEPRQDRPAPEPLDLALHAYALSRWAGTPGVDPALVEPLREEARALLVRAGSSSGTMSAATAAMWLVAEGQAGAPAGSASSPGAPDPQAATLAVARGTATEALARALGEGEQAAPVLAALLALAGAEQAAARSDPDMLRRADAVLRSAYSRTPPGEWVSLLPWAGWAEQSIAGARQRLTGQASPMDSAATLRDIRDQVWKHQIGATDVAAVDRDLIGGIVFTRGRQPLPTWQSLRPLAFLATMMGDPTLTPPEEFPGQVLRMLSSLRFLRQLTADEGVMSWCPGQAWAVRAAVWTGDQPSEASPMGLLVVSETLRSLDEVQRRREAAR